jgi:maleate isomerase
MRDASNSPEYGPVAGMLVPQANTTVEPELQVLLGAECTLLTARMLCSAADPRQRLLAYYDDLVVSLKQFDIAPLQVAGFACTGASYLVGLADDRARTLALSQAQGYPVLSAALCISAALQALDAQRIALFSPYPAWLSDAGKAYWQDSGFSIASVANLPTGMLDTRNIYKLQSADVQQVLGGIATAGCDAVLMSGTGMPSLRAIAQQRLPIPVLSSNLCLAWAMQCALQPLANAKALLLEMLSANAAWRARLKDRA